MYFIFKFEILSCGESSWLLQRWDKSKSESYVLQTQKKPFKKKSWKALISVAGWLGFEPRLTESESVVLPLDDQPAEEQRQGIYNKGMTEVKKIFVENWDWIGLLFLINITENNNLDVLQSEIADHLTLK